MQWYTGTPVALANLSDDLNWFHSPTLDTLEICLGPGIKILSFF